jgi:hypothetical protein
MLYQRVNEQGQHVGPPAPLPEAVRGASDEVLADLNAYFDHQALLQLGLLGAGFLPVPPEPPPEPEPEPKRITRIGFMQRIPTPKRIAIRVAAKTEPIIEDFLDLLSATDLIELDHPDTLMGVQYLVMQGLLTQAEAEAVLE